MQARTAVPRSHMDPDEVQALLSASRYDVDYVVELLDLNDQPVEDISEDVSLDGSLSWNGAADLHRDASLKISRDLAWDRDRLRLSMVVTAPLLGLTATFHRAVLLVTRPTQTVTDARFSDGRGGVHLAEAWECKAWDKMRLLRDPAGRSWATAWTETAQTTFYGQEARRLLSASPWTGPVLVHPDLELVLLTQPYVWLNDGAISWARILNELSGAAGGAKAWVDEVGALHLDPIVDAATRPADWYLGDDEDTIIGPQRTRTLDLGAIPNRWRFVAQNFPRTPVLHDGIYEPEPNESIGPASFAARGRWVQNSNQILDAVSHEALVAQGDAQRLRDMAALATRQITTSPLPLMGHDDLYDLDDAATGEPVRALASTWTERWDGADTTLTVQELP